MMNLRMKMMSTIRQGWREFWCENCGFKCEWPCRDYASPSNEFCAECFEPMAIVSSRPDGSIPVDGNGNLIYKEYEESKELPSATRSIVEKAVDRVRAIPGH